MPNASAPPAIVLVNLGTPASPQPKQVKRFLRQFLTDQRVVEFPKVLWRGLLELIILPVRAPKSARKYAAIWSDAASPLAWHTAHQAVELSRRLGSAGRLWQPPGVVYPGVQIASAGQKTGLGVTPQVAWAMRYGEPSISRVLRHLTSSGFDKILVLPLFPQYSSTTTGSVYDAVARSLLTARNQPELRIVRSFANHPAYIKACASQIETAWAKSGHPDFRQGDRLILSFHGIPQSMVRAGDPYPDECQHTAQLLRQQLGLTTEQAPLTFQSKFGPAAWLQPATIDTVSQLGQDQVGRVDVFCPGFVADCLETLEEIALLNRQAFLQARQTCLPANTSQQGPVQAHFEAIACLNQSDDFIAALAQIVHQHVAGWVERPNEQTPSQTEHSGH